MAKNFPEIVLCRDCKWSKVSILEYEKDRLYCHHPLINVNDPEVLASVHGGMGTPCKTVRDNHQWFSKCGMGGKLFEKSKKDK